MHLFFFDLAFLEVKLTWCLSEKDKEKKQIKKKGIDSDQMKGVTRSNQTTTATAFLFFFSPSKDKNEAVCIKKRKWRNTHTHIQTQKSNLLNVGRLEAYLTALAFFFPCFFCQACAMRCV